MYKYRLLSILAIAQLLKVQANSPENFAPDESETFTLELTISEESTGIYAGRTGETLQETYHANGGTDGFRESRHFSYQRTPRNGPYQIVVITETPPKEPGASSSPAEIRTFLTFTGKDSGLGHSESDQGSQNESMLSFSFRIIRPEAAALAKRSSGFKDSKVPIIQKSENEAEFDSLTTHLPLTKELRNKIESIDRTRSYWVLIGEVERPYTTAGYGWIKYTGPIAKVEAVSGDLLYYSAIKNEIEASAELGTEKMKSMEDQTRQALAELNGDFFRDWLDKTLGNRKIPNGSSLDDMRKLLHGSAMIYGTSAAEIAAEKKRIEDVVTNYNGLLHPQMPETQLGILEGLLAADIKHGFVGKSDLDHFQGVEFTDPSLLKETTPTVGVQWNIPGLDIPLAPIKAGSFERSLGWDNNGKELSQKITLSKAFWLGKTPITKRQYYALMQKNWTPPEDIHQKDQQHTVLLAGMVDVREDLRVDGISWDDAMAFCNALNDRERASGRLPSGYEYSLPTEAQWIYTYIMDFPKNRGEYSTYGDYESASYGRLDRDEFRSTEWLFDFQRPTSGSQPYVEPSPIDPIGPPSGAARSTTTYKRFNNPKPICGFRVALSPIHKAVASTGAPDKDTANASTPVEKGNPFSGTTWIGTGNEYIEFAKDAHYITSENGGPFGRNGRWVLSGPSEATMTIAMNNNEKRVVVFVIAPDGEHLREKTVTVGNRAIAPNPIVRTLSKPIEAQRPKAKTQPTATVQNSNSTNEPHGQAQADQGKPQKKKLEGVRKGLSFLKGGLKSLSEDLGSLAEPTSPSDSSAPQEAPPDPAATKANRLTGPPPGELHDLAYFYSGSYTAPDKTPEAIEQQKQRETASADAKARLSIDGKEIDLLDEIHRVLRAKREFRDRDETTRLSPLDFFPSPFNGNSNLKMYEVEGGLIAADNTYIGKDRQGFESLYAVYHFNSRAEAIGSYMAFESIALATFTNQKKGGSKWERVGLGKREPHITWDKQFKKSTNNDDYGVEYYTRENQVRFKTGTIPGTNAIYIRYDDHRKSVSLYTGPNASLSMHYMTIEMGANTRKDYWNLVKVTSGYTSEFHGERYEGSVIRARPTQYRDDLDTAVTAMLNDALQQAMSSDSKEGDSLADLEKAIAEREDLDDEAKQKLFAETKAQIADSQNSMEVQKTTPQSFVSETGVQGKYISFKIVNAEEKFFGVMIAVSLADGSIVSVEYESPREDVLATELELVLAGMRVDPAGRN